MDALERVVRELKELEGLIVQCSRCGTCQSVCPLYKKDRRESSVARGKMHLVEALYEGRLEKAGEIFAYLDYCLLCGRCRRECPSGVRTDEVFLRAKSVLRRVKEMPAWQRFVLRTAMEKPRLLAALTPVLHAGFRLGAHKGDDGLWRAASPFRALLGEGGGRSLPEIPKKAFTSRYGGFNSAPKERMRVIFYPGCAITLIFADWGEAIVELLLRHGISVYVPEVNRCCGIPSATMGEMEIYRGQVEANSEWFDGIADADTVITACPTCEYALAEMGETVTGRKRNKRFVDIVAFLEEALGEELPTGVSLEGSATLHVPCHYPPAKVGSLKAFIKRRFDVDYRDLENQSCCGFGGTFNLKHYPDSSQVGRGKAEEVREREFKTLFTPCPGCTMQLSDACGDVGAVVRVTHPVVALYNALQRGASS